MYEQASRNTRGVLSTVKGLCTNVKILTDLGAPGLVVELNRASGSLKIVCLSHR